MSKEIDELLEIDSSLEINLENSSTIIHILIRFFLPFLIAGIGGVYIDKFDDSYSALFLVAGLVCISLLYVFFEMIYYSVNNKKNLAFANLKVIGLWILCIAIVVIFIWFFE
jgi:hypothetical protein